MHCKLAVSAALVGLLAQVATATSCTPANATPLEQYISSGSGGGGGGGFVISQDPYKWVSYAVKKRATPNAQLANIANILPPRSLDNVDCSATEMCFSLANTPFCLDVTNGDFHDGVGTTGNALTGAYTLADGRKGNLYTGPYPQVTVSGAAAANAGGATTTSAGGAGAGGASQTGAPSSSSAAETGAGTGTTGSVSKAGAAPSATPTGSGSGSGSVPSPTKNAAVGNAQAGRVAAGGVVALLGAVWL